MEKIDLAFIVFFVAEMYLKYGKDIELDKNSIPFKNELLEEKHPLFVSWVSKEKGLRGSIGNFEKKILYENVINLTKSSLFNDSRFNPVKYEEFKNLRVEVNLLKNFKKIKNLDEWNHVNQGLIIKNKEKKISATYYPEVCVEHEMDKIECAISLLKKQKNLNYEVYPHTDESSALKEINEDSELETYESIKYKMNFDIYKMLKDKLIRKMNFSSWYENNPKDFKNQIQKTKKLCTVRSLTKNNAYFVKSLVLPHAGHFYTIENWFSLFDHYKFQNIHNVFILAPLHRHSTQNKAYMSCFNYFETPFGVLKNNNVINRYLRNQKFFEYIERKIDEDEHSLELMLPIIHYFIKPKHIIPIYVNNGSKSFISEISKILKKFFEKNNNIFIVSTDMTHFGENFGDTVDNISLNEISKQCSKRWVDLIVKKDIKNMFEFYKEDRSVCGFYPLMVLMELSNFSKYNIIHYCSSSSLQKSKSKKEKKSFVNYETFIVEDVILKKKYISKNYF